MDKVPHCSFAKLVVFRGINSHQADALGADFQTVAVNGDCRSCRGFFLKTV